MNLLDNLDAVWQTLPVDDRILLLALLVFGGALAKILKPTTIPQWVVPPAVLVLAFVLLALRYDDVYTVMVRGLIYGGLTSYTYEAIFKHLIEWVMRWIKPDESHLP